MYGLGGKAHLVRNLPSMQIFVIWAQDSWQLNIRFLQSSGTLGQNMRRNRLSIVIILGFCRIIFVCNFIPNTAVKYFGLCQVLSPSIITQHVQRRLYFTFTRILSSFLVSCTEIMLIYSTSNEFCTWDVQIMIIVLFK